MFRVAVSFDLAQLFEQEPVVVFGCDDQGLAIEPGGGPCEGSKDLPAIAVEG